MELTKTLTNTYEIKYVDCKFELEDLSQCRINNVSSTAQTIKNLPFLTYKRSGFEWNPRIILETGQVVCWPKGIRATINFQLKSCREKITKEDIDFPKYCLFFIKNIC